MKQYMCVICGLIYDEEKGWPDDNIALGTKWNDVPADWFCPECGATKEDFEMVEV
jgi:rubredoxin